MTELEVAVNCLMFHVIQQSLFAIWKRNYQVWSRIPVHLWTEQNVCRIAQWCALSDKWELIYTVERIQQLASQFSMGHEVPVWLLSIVLHFYKHFSQASECLSDRVWSSWGRFIVFFLNSPFQHVDKTGFIATMLWFDAYILERFDHVDVQ